MKRLVSYARVSTQDQEKYGYSIPNQLEFNRRWAASNNYFIVKEITEDFTGRVLERPGLSEALSALDQGEAEGIICHVPDRLSRILHHRVIIRQSIFDIGAELIFVNKGVLKNTPDDIMMDNIDGAVAQRELDRIRERTQEGRSQKARSGIPVGNGAIAFGYRMVNNRKESHYVIDESEAELVTLIFSMYLEGWSTVQIANYFTEQGHPSYYDKRTSRQKDRKGWASTTIYNILRNETYIGKLYYGKSDGAGRRRDRSEWIEIQVPAIIEERVFYQVQRLLQKRTWKKKRDLNHLLAGRLTCLCGYSLTTSYGGRKKSTEPILYYRCVASKGHVVQHCDMRHIRADRLDAQVWEWIDNLMRDPNTVAQAYHEIQQLAQSEGAYSTQRLNLIEREIGKVEGELQRLLDAYKLNLFPVHIINRSVQENKDLLVGLHAERDKLQQEISTNRLRYPGEDVLYELATSIRARLIDPDIQTMREVVRDLGLEGKINPDAETISITCYLGERTFHL